MSDPGFYQQALDLQQPIIEQSEQIETQLMELMERWEQLEAEMANGSEK